MKHVIFLLVLFSGSTLHAGVTIGGSTGQQKLALEMATHAFQLPELPVESALYRRTAARLETQELVAISVDGEPVRVRRILDRIIDEDFSKEIVPAE